MEEMKNLILAILLPYHHFRFVGNIYLMPVVILLDIIRKSQIKFCFFLPLLIYFNPQKSYTNIKIFIKRISKVLWNIDRNRHYGYDEMEQIMVVKVIGSFISFFGTHRFWNAQNSLFCFHVDSDRKISSSVKRTS